MQLVTLHSKPRMFLFVAKQGFLICTLVRLRASIQWLITRQIVPGFNIYDHITIFYGSKQS